MKIASSLLFAFVNGQSDGHVDGSSVHLGGCIWPEKNQLSPKLTYADDPYARFASLDGTGTDAPYAEGSSIVRQCPSACDFDGSDFVNCSGYTDTLTFTCGYKDGKNDRFPGRHYVFKDGNRKIALFYRTPFLNKYRPVPPHKLCPKPTISIGDTAAVCGDKPQIPNSDDARSIQFTQWTDDGNSVECKSGARPIRKGSYEQLNLVCDRKNPRSSYKWFHKSPNNKLRPAGNRWIKSRFLCRFCHSCEPETSGDGSGEGSGSDSPDDAEVTL